MIRNEKGQFIKDNNKGYSPENCLLLSHEEHMKLHWQSRGK